MATDPFDSELSPEVAALFAAARATEPVAENPALFAAMAGAAASGLTSSAPTPRRRSMIGKVLTAKAAAVAGALFLTGGVAAAATGSLPDPVQDAASDAADVVGVNIPHGKTVSEVARDKSNDGDENHGKTVSETARDNHGHNKDTTSTTVEGENRGPGNSNGAGKSEDSHASDNARNKPSVDDDDDDDDSTTSTTIDDDAPDTDEDEPDTDEDDGPSGKNRGSEKSGRDADDSGKGDSSDD